ncbi:MAG: hypothetical protein EOP87_15330, partial [Verrucomicrobiaceae bacterium]
MKTIFRLLLVSAAASLNLMAQTPEELRKEHNQLYNRGMFRDAVDFYSEKLLPLSDDQSGHDLKNAVMALSRLDAWKEFDALVERSIDTHPANTALLTSAAEAYLNAPHYGRIVAGDFERHQGGYRGFRGRPQAAGQQPEPAVGQDVATSYRDRIRGLQLLQQATARADADLEKLRVWQSMQEALRRSEAWKFQTLTPLGTLPEWGEPGPDGGTEGAPWAGEGPLLYQVPASWDAAANDGERWRFSLAEIVRLAKLVNDPRQELATISERAAFSQSQFSTETLASYGWWQQQDPQRAKGILEMDTLAEDECLAKTSDGVRRFKLPADQHFIALLRSLMADKSYGPSAGDRLVQIFLNRLQPDKAREALERTIADHGPGSSDERKLLLQQITGDWGRFEPTAIVPAGVKPRVPLVFRNATSVKLTVSPVDMEAVLRDTQDYLKGNPREFQWDRVTPSQIAGKLIVKEGEKYIGKVAHEWEEKLSPRDKHRDTRTEFDLPVDTAGAWWVTATMGDVVFHTLVWSVDSVLVENDVAGKKQWWVAEAGGGTPVAGTEIEFFGYRTIYQERKNPLARRLEVVTRTFKRTTDADGKTLLAPGDWDDEYQWIAIARKEGRTTAFHGFAPYSVQTSYLENGNRDLSYGISDRPL